MKEQMKSADKTKAMEQCGWLCPKCWIWPTLWFSVVQGALSFVGTDYLLIVSSFIVTLYCMYACSKHHRERCIFGGLPKWADVLVVVIGTPTLFWLTMLTLWLGVFGDAPSPPGTAEGFHLMYILFILATIFYFRTSVDPSGKWWTLPTWIRGGFYGVFAVPVIFVFRASLVLILPGIISGIIGQGGLVDLPVRMVQVVLTSWLPAKKGGFLKFMIFAGSFAITYFFYGAVIGLCRDWLKRAQRRLIIGVIVVAIIGIIGFFIWQSNSPFISMCPYSELWGSSFEDCIQRYGYSQNDLDACRKLDEYGLNDYRKQCFNGVRLRQKELQPPP